MARTIKDAEREEHERIAKAFGRPVASPPIKETPASNSSLWRPKGEKPQDDAQWLADGGWSGKR